MTNMRAKMRVSGITKYETCEVLRFTAVYKNNYDGNGSDEDNTYAKFTPSASVDITIANPDLIGKFSEGEVYYVDFTPVPKT